MKEPPISAINWKGFPRGATILRVGEKTHNMDGDIVEACLMMWTDRGSLRKAHFVPNEEKKEWIYIGESLK